jgi:hypothetical protein
MFDRLLRAIDLQFRVTRRSQDAFAAARVAGLPVNVMYDGGTEVKADDLRPHFKSGVPMVEQPDIVVIARPHEDGVLEIFRALYDTRWDKLFPLDRVTSRPGQRVEKRRSDDLWLSEGEYHDAFCAAAAQLSNRRRRPDGANRAFATT